MGRIRSIIKDNMGSEKLGIGSYFDTVVFAWNEPFGRGSKYWTPTKWFISWYRNIILSRIQMNIRGFKCKCRGSKYWTPTFAFESQCYMLIEEFIVFPIFWVINNISWNNSNRPFWSDYGIMKISLPYSMDICIGSKPFRHSYFKSTYDTAKGSGNYVLISMFKVTLFSGLGLFIQIIPG